MGYKGTEPYEGLATLHWAAVDEGCSEQPENLRRMRRAVKRFGQPALEVGCGSGRLLLELRRQGFEVDGCDLSLEMLNLCVDAARRRGLDVDLYWQAMQRLDLPRRYKVILVPCGSFMHLVEQTEALEALGRFHTHLEPGGALVLDLYLGNPRLVTETLPAEWEKVMQLPQPSAGASLVVEKRAYTIDPLEQIFTAQRRYRLLHRDRVVREEVRPAKYRWYGKVELEVMLAWAGFQDVEIAVHNLEQSNSHEFRERPRMVVTAQRGRHRPADRSQH